MSVLLSENQFWIFLTHGNANFCSYAFSEKSIFVEKIEKKNSFPIKTVGKNRMLKPVFNNATYFESRNSKASDLKPFFYKSGSFESKILELIIFGTKTFTTRQILKWKMWCMKTDFDDNFALTKSLSDPYIPWKRHFLQLCSFPKATKWWKRWQKKQFSNQDFWKGAVVGTIF